MCLSGDMRVHPTTKQIYVPLCCYVLCDTPSIAGADHGDLPLPDQICGIIDTIVIFINAIVIHINNVSINIVLTVHGSAFNRPSKRHRRD